MIRREIPGALQSVVAGKKYVTPHGTGLYVCLIQPGDEPLLLHLLNHLSPETWSHRFRVGPERVDAQTIQQETTQFADTDYRDTAAIMALTVGEDEPIGVASLARIDGRPEAEVAVVVRDDFQRQGVGLWLLTLLLQLAKDMGFQALWATAELYNMAIKQLLLKVWRAGYPLTVTTLYGESEIHLSLVNMVEPEGADTTPEVPSV